MEKNTRVNAENNNRNFSGLNCEVEPESRQAPTAPRTIGSNHGKAPSASSARKYHQGSTRWASWVRKRWKCSWTKKNGTKSALRRDTRMNQGAASARKSGTPRAKCMRRQGLRSRSSAEYETSVPPASTKTTMPLLNTARAAAAQQTSIQLRSALERGT